LYEDTVIANLHIQVAVVPNVRSLVNIVLDATSDNYAWWCDYMLLALTRYALADHIESNDAFPDNPGWTRMDVVVLSWLTNTISPDLMEVVRECGRTSGSGSRTSSLVIVRHVLFILMLPSAILYKATSP
jgi:hypothetical protein